MSLLRQAERCFANQQTFKALNAFITPPKDYTRLYQEAQRADARQSQGKAKSPLDGCIIAVKDNICTVDEPTTCASKILDDFISPSAATVIQKLKAAGVMIAGKTNLDEFGMGSHSTNSSHGPVKSHYNYELEPFSAGGSSGGSAVAVASEQCFAALGTDTGGSVRLPAAYCGIIGFKPSYGLVSRWGVIAYANSLDTVGVLARNSQVAKSIFGIIKGYDAHDPTSISTATRSMIADHICSRGDRRLLRVGIPIEYNVEELDPIVRQVWLQTLTHLRNQGHLVQEISLPLTRSALSAYYVLATAEASSNLSKYDGVRFGNKSSKHRESGDSLYSATRGDGLGEEVRRRILLGSYSLSAAAKDNYFIKAQKVRRLVQQDFDRAFALTNPLLENMGKDNGKNGVDIIISPTAQSLPPRLGSISSSALVNTYTDDTLTVPPSLAGLPAISVPISRNDESNDPMRPSTVGLQVIAQYGDDDLLFDVARILETL